jgi:muconate cycloisomerase
MTGETVDSMMAAVRILTPSLLGRDPADIDGARAAVDGPLYGNNAAKAAIEIALHDIAGQASQRPVYALLGTKRRDRTPLLGIIAGGNFDGDIADAAKKRAEGFTAFKIKVGIDNAANDAKRSREICKLLGPGLLISADANQGFGTNDAIGYVRAMSGSGLDFFEQPVMSHDLAGMAAVAAAANGIAIGADEGIHSLEDIRRHHDRKAAAGVSLKAIKLGGMRGVVAAAELCEQLGMSVNLACKTGESSIACAAAVHIAAVIPNVAWAFSMTNGGLKDDVTDSPLRGARGFVDTIERPGLGIAVDEDRVRRHRLA